MTYLEEVKARYEAATEGPWRGVENADYVPPVKGLEKHRQFLLDGVSPGKQDHIASIYSFRTEEDSAFIAHSREDMPWLVKMVERQAKLLKRACAWWPEKSSMDDTRPDWVDDARSLLVELEGK